MRKTWSSLDDLLQRRVELAGRLEVGAERLLDDEPRPSVRPSRPSMPIIGCMAVGGTDR